MKNVLNGGHLFRSYDYLVQCVDANKEDYECNKLNEKTAHFPLKQRYMEIFPVAHERNKNVELR